MKVFHHNDMDGLGAASIVMQCRPDSNLKDYIRVNYEADVPEKFSVVVEGEEVWIVDYSFTENTCHILQELMDKNCKIIWIDHHDSSVELEKSHPEFKILRGIRSKECSGIALTYMHIYNKTFKECPYYVQLISDYDTFAGKMKPESDWFKLGYDAEKDKFKILDELFKNRMDQSSTSKIMEIGKIIKNFLEVDYKSYRNNNGFESAINGVKTFVINRKCNSWIFGEKYDEYPLVCSYVYNGKNYVYSIYSSDPSVDCSKIAEKFGGGGHKGAAGFSSKELVFDK